MAAWGLLKGLGEGLSFAGASMAKTQEDQAKEARLEEYRKAAALEQRQYQEGQTAKQWAREDANSAKAIARTKTYVDNGQKMAQDTNSEGVNIGDAYSQGAVTVDHSNIKMNRYGAFDANTNTWIPTPGSGGASKVQTATTTDENGDKVTVQLGNDGTWSPIQLNGNNNSSGNSPARLKAAQSILDSLSKAEATGELTADQQTAKNNALAIVSAYVAPKPDGSKEHPLVFKNVEEVTNASVPQGAFVNVGGRTWQMNKSDATPQNVVPGNMSPEITNKDGSTGYLPSMTFSRKDGTAVLIPVVSTDGKQLTEKQAIAQFAEGGKYFAAFPNENAAKQYASNLYGGDKQKSQTPGNGTPAAPPAEAAVQNTDASKSQPASGLLSQYMLPAPNFSKGPQDEIARFEYAKQLNQSVDTVTKAMGRDNGLKALGIPDMRMALSGNITDAQKQAIVKEIDDRSNGAINGPSFPGLLKKYTSAAPESTPGPYGENAKVYYAKSANKAVEAVKNAMNSANKLKSMSVDDMKMALGGNLTAEQKQAVVKELYLRGER